MTKPARAWPEPRERMAEQSPSKAAMLTNEVESVNYHLPQ